MWTPLDYNSRPARPLVGLSGLELEDRFADGMGCGPALASCSFHGWLVFAARSPKTGGPSCASGTAVSTISAGEKKRSGVPALLQAWKSASRGANPAQTPSADDAVSGNLEPLEQEQPNK